MMPAASSYMNSNAVVGQYVEKWLLVHRNDAKGGSSQSNDCQRSIFQHG